MAWFNFLKAEGYFAPEKNPEPIQVNDGYQVPYWDILEYLEKLSIQISQGNEPELIDELLTIIRDVSEHPKDNYRTWYVFIKILSNIPNERVPNEILDFIPLWLSGRFDTMLQTSEICDNLLPKFLNDEPTKADIEKAELILYYLFQVERDDKQEDFWEGEGNSYRSKTYLYFLADRFEKGDIISKVVKYCSAKVILDLGRTIKFLLLDYPKGIMSSLKDGDKEYEIKIFIEKENLSISSKLKDDEIANATSTLLNWENKNEEQLKEEVVKIFKEQNIIYTPTNERDDTFERLNFMLNNDIASLYRLNSIRKLDDRYSDTEKVLNVFVLIFRNLLNEKVKQNPEEGLKILQKICFDSNYKLPFYKRVSLYVICENWEATKSLFWYLVKDNDSLNLFSIYKYQKEVYDLLSRNQKAFDANEIQILENIIEQGKQDKFEEQTDDQKEYWKLGWYSALKEIEPFKDKYLEFSEKFKTTSEDFENLGEVQFSSGSVSPISTDDLLEKSNQEIVEYIKSFNPKMSFSSPSISGLSETFEKAVESEPERFTEEIELYLDIPYAHSYRMLQALSEAWKKQKSFDWEKVLNYCLNTLKSPKFQSGELQLENDDWHVTQDWVTGAISNLISRGLEDNKHAFDIKLLPLAKEVILVLASNLERVDDFEKNNLDYPTYSLNSTAGKSLKALFYYSLHRARNLFKQEDNGKWEEDVKSLYEDALKKGIIDAFIMQGMYFQQFYFLDKNWITEQVKQHYTIDEREWLAFMGGFTFGRPPFNKELYEIFYPHYERAIDTNAKFKSFGNNGLVRHIVSFYFWKYETLSSEKLLFKFINQSPANEVGELINFIWHQRNYPKTLSELDQKEFNKIILELWEYLANKYDDSSIDEEQKNLASLINWIEFVPELNDTYTNLILKSSKYVDRNHSRHILLENLVALKAKGNPKTTAEAIGKIISSLTFREYISGFDKEFIKELIIFLFINRQRNIAMKFCNEMASVYQDFFLREIYDTYTNNTKK
ncbi:hypothetical protein [Elizabethkingia meningoseptica]|uniref:hypothetical protein n=1 Tax=Elizabethkingia meningoseptica TaxID=238 RepID=UPI000935B612|nr:hypothetical protein [Elizabethkingia meningoseptica]MDE5487295.1 hypothetical protein [Elizabethkingia meningoseptica]MVW93707.1 hypothetical protein [Elizabethkingia meningoseptica]